MAAKPRRKIPKPKGRPSFSYFSYEEAKKVIERIMAAERQSKARSRKSR